MAGYKVGDVISGQSDEAYIYVLVDPRDDKIHYVGCSFNPASRLREHVSNAKTAFNRNVKLSRKNHWIIQLLLCQHHPLMRIIDICSIAEAPDKEREHYDRLLPDNELLNGHRPSLSSRLPGYGPLDAQAKNTN